MNNRTKTRSWAFPLIVVAVVLVLYYVWIGTSTQTSTSWNQFRKAVESGAIASVTIEQNKEVPTGRLRFTYNGETLVVNVSDVNEAQQYLEDNSVAYVVRDIPSDNVFLNTMLPMLIVAVMVLLICFLFVGPILSGNAGGGGGSNQMSNFGRSRAQMIMPGKKGINFNLVAGLEEEKEELEEVVDFLKDPQKYTNMGARIPKGILLVGSPGTGKTLLAKAVAGEANVPFFSISGSDFVEMFVGVGAARVRDLFASAKQHAPCIIFIDEIDAVARRRGTGMGGGHDEREQTLNQMLVEMDGFQINEGIIVMAATNRVDILDPAILRPGRFDRKVGVGRPDVKGRREILNVHVKNKPLGDDVDLDRVAKTTSGFTGADLENLVNEAAIRAAKSGRPYICQEDIDSSFVKVGIGAEKRSKLISDREKKITAYHESGHAILFHLLPDVGPVHTISIIPTGMGAAGYTMPLPGDDEMFRTKKRMLEDITVSLGGRIAEELVFGDVTTGASQDIKQATATARAMVTQYGMSDELGMIQYGSDDDEVFIGRDLAHTRSYSEGVAEKIDEEVKAIIDRCYTEGKALIEAHRQVLEDCAQLLIEREKIGTEEFEALFRGEKVEG
ncbi:MAG: ATP-dependent zinc metalloprotease FtsH [Lachnospiraceae bacterium]|nr:ATP-dependent zinc metalloprotease FtsH [Cuneatibacter sp.]MDD6456078.1 ATP-dependent zinc metalloprotease FtsH [Lachnospiraceae bacterium]